MCFLISSLTFGQSFAKFGHAIQVSELGTEVPETERTPIPEKDKTAPKECSSKDQTSLPQEDIKALMIYKGKSIKSYSSLSGDYLNVELESPIIGNCAAMLEPKVTYSKKHSKYLYEVKVRNTCEEKECEYQVSRLENDEKKVSTKKYEPTLSGFYKCMQENVGVNEKKTAWNKSNIVNKDLAKASVEAPFSSDLLFVSKGPAGMQNSKKKNLISNNDCDFFEQVNDDYFTHYSSEDLESMRLEEKAQRLCKEGDYSNIESSLSSFLGNGQLYQTMAGVRDQLLLEEIKAERERLQDLIADKNIGEEIDSEKFKKLMEDFYSLIIDKNLSTKNHTEQDQDNEDLLVNMRAEYDIAYKNKDKDEMKRLAKLIADKVDELSDYMVEPYFDVKDFKAMTSLETRPEIENDDWRDASKTLHKSIMSLKLLCEAYGTSKTCEERQPTNQNFKKKKSGLTSLAAVEKKVEDYNEKSMDNYDEKVTLVTNPTGYKSLKYQKLLTECENHAKVSEQYATGIQSQITPITQACTQQSGGNQQALQACIKRYQFQISGDANSLKLKQENCTKMKTHYTTQKEKWEELEEQRDDYLDYSDEEKKKRKEKVAKVLEKEKTKYTFNYKGITAQNTTQTNTQFRSNTSTPSLATNPYNNNSSIFNNNSSIFSNNQMNSNYSNPYSYNNYNMYPNYNNGTTSYYNSNYRSPSTYYGNTGLNFGLNTYGNTGINTNYGNNYYGNTGINSNFGNTGYNTNYGNTGFNFGNSYNTTVPATSTTGTGFQFTFN